MSSLASIISKDPVRALIYGVTGSAKTTLVALATKYPEFTPMYFADWDLRIASLRAIIPSSDYDKIHADPYRDVQIGGEAFTRFQAFVANIEQTPYKSWCIDSFTSLLEGIMAHVLKLASKPANAIPSLPNYMERQSIVKQLITTMCGKNLHLFVNCHEDTAKDEITGRLFKSFDMDPKLQNRIPNYFNEVWHTEIVTTTAQGTQRMIRTRSDMVYAARTSYKTLVDVEQQNTIWQKIAAERQTDPPDPNIAALVPITPMLK